MRWLVSEHSYDRRQSVWVQWIRNNISGITPDSHVALFVPTRLLNSWRNWRAKFPVRLLLPYWMITEPIVVQSFQIIYRSLTSTIHRIPVKKAALLWRLILISTRVNHSRDVGSFKRHQNLFFAPRVPWSVKGQILVFLVAWISRATFG